MPVKFFTVFVALSLTSCSFSKFASNQTAVIFKTGAPVFEEESDIEVAEQASLGLLKTLEAFHRHNPENEDYLLLLTKSYGNYAFGFLENRMLQYQDKDPVRYNTYLRRAKLFYLRGKEYGLKLIEKKDKDLRKAIEEGIQPLQTAVARYQKEEVEPLFWTALSWANYINLTKDEVRSVSDLHLVEVMMARVLEVDPTFFYGGPQLFYGVYYASRPPILGGNPEKARQHFEEAAKSSDGKFLMTYALEAQFLAVQLQDRPLFHDLLGRIDSANVDLLPEQRLANSLAKERADLLRGREKSLF